MLLYFIRALFIIVITAVLFTSITAEDGPSLAEDSVFFVFLGGIILAIILLLVDILIPKKSLSALAGVFFGLLVGMFFSWALSPVLEMFNDVFRLQFDEATMLLSKWLLGVCTCYLVISFVMRTKDDVRFVIPYVEFARQTKGVRPLVLDTSVIIDGRIADISQSKLFDAPLVVPRFVLNELQMVADSPDKLKRVRGRRGLDMLHKLQNNEIVEVKIDDTPPPGIDPNAAVDQKLVAFTKSCNGKLVTNDYNLNKVARLRDVEVININDLANALKSIVLPGEPMQIKIVKAGEEAQQGIGYLDDGTMVVIEEGKNRIAEEVLITVTSSLQTSAGRMIFGKYEKTIKPARNNSRGNNRSN